MRRLQTHSLRAGLRATKVLLVPLLALFFVVTSCTDERTPPTQPENPSYTETQTLLSDAVSSGEAVNATFNLRDEVVAGRFYITCMLQPDDDLVQYEAYGDEMEDYKSANESLDILIIDYQLRDTLSAQDSLALDSLMALKAANLDSIALRELQRDSLDTYLDDRFKLSVWLDGDSVEYYPSAVYLDSTALPYLGDEMVVWGQGFYLTPQDSGAQFRGKTVRLDLDEFLVADGGWDAGEPYIHPVKPARGTALPEQFPIRDWLERLTPGSPHTLHVRFGSEGTVTRVTATLYVVYNTEG